jgi:hypothetical protein
VEHCLEALKDFPERAGLLRELASFILQRTH